MPSASSAVTYTSVYTDFKPGRVFWGADEELSDDSPPRVIVYGYDGLPMQPDPEEYEDDETEDGPVDYPMDGRDDRDDDDGDSFGDDADDEDKDEEDEHLAPADSAVVIPTVELVSPPERTEHVIPPPSTDTTTTRARITVQLQVSIPLPPEAEVERLLAMPTPPPSPLTSLSPPSARKHTQDGLYAVTAALPSPPLSPLPPPIYIPPPIDRRDDITETEMPPHKRSCLFALGSRYEIGESSTARPTGGDSLLYLKNSLLCGGDLLLKIRISRKEFKGVCCGGVRVSRGLF
nr:hypothetical protein [Tanacetum cinerariifolium]